MKPSGVYGHRRRYGNTLWMYGVCIVCIALVFIAFCVLFVFKITTDKTADENAGGHHGENAGHYYEHAYSDDYSSDESSESAGKCPRHIHHRNVDGTDQYKKEWRGISGSSNGRYDAPGYFRQDYDDRHRPNPRKISNKLFQQPKDHPRHHKYTSAVWSFGQFVDHVIGLTPSACGHAPPIKIDITNDYLFDPENNGLYMTLDPSDYHTDENGYRHPINSITHFVDGSVVYGSSSDRTKHLRKWKHGLLDLQYIPGRGEWLPYNKWGMENAPKRYNTSFFLAGDVRVNEQSPLTTWHTLFLREHNYQARRIYHAYPDWDDECIFHAAKNLVVYEIQKIIYEEFLPALLCIDKFPEKEEHTPPPTGGHYEPGYHRRAAQKRSTYSTQRRKRSLDDAAEQSDGSDSSVVPATDATDAVSKNRRHPGYYQSYHDSSDLDRYGDDVDPRIYAEFSGAAFRLHTLVNDNLELRDPKTGEVIVLVELREAFFTPNLTLQYGIDPFLLGLFKQHAEQFDSLVVDSLRNFLFFNVDGKRRDLVSFNIARGRELGLPDYARLLYKMGCVNKPIQSWEDLRPFLSEANFDNLVMLYGEYGWDNIDLFVGLMSERIPEGDVLGKLEKKIIIDQFVRLRDADNFFWKTEKGMNPDLKKYISESSLRDIVLRNTEIDGGVLPEDLFLH